MVVHQDGYIKWIRSHVGHELIYLVYSVGIILDDQDRILVQRRYEFDWWDLVGGAKEINETIAEGMKREAREECGLEVEIERLVGVYSHPRFTVRYPHGDLVQPWAVCFVCRVVGGTIKPDGKETISAEFKSVAELVPHPHPMFAQILQDVFFSAHQDMVLEIPFVNDDPKPYFPILRKHVQQAPIILPGVIMLVRDDVGRILVIKHIEFGVWDLPGGFSDLGETTSYTAIREMREETGLEVEVLRPLGIYSDPAFMRAQYSNGDVNYGVGLLMECRIIGGTLQADGVEISDIQYMTPAEIRNQPNLRPLTRQILDDLENMAGQPFIR